MKKILITYEYFLPAYKAGGPVQSIANLCAQMGSEYEFYVICSNKEMGEEEQLRVPLGAWTRHAASGAWVYYLTKEEGVKRMRQLITDLAPDRIFVNGIFSPTFSLAPLSVRKSQRILSVRGMLHPGALRQKSSKKKLFLNLMKMSGLGKSVTFHATDEQEASYIRKVFGSGTQTLVARNFGSSTHLHTYVPKEPGQLNLVSVALISPMKNHLAILKELKQVKANIRYDIYGPVKEPAYWELCEAEMKQMPDNIEVHYHGSLEPEKVGTVLSRSHAFILPSESENFGHAIFEGLSAGLPVITSHGTPWNGLEAAGAGFNLDPHEPGAIAAAVEKLAGKDGMQQVDASQRARAYAEARMNIEHIKNEYRQLFG